MREETRSCTVNAGQSRVWDFLTDYQSTLRLAVSDAEATLIEGRAGAAGARYLASVSWEGISARYYVRLDEAQAFDLLKWSTRSHGGHCSSVYELTPLAPDSTRVDLTLRYAASAANRPLEPFAWGLLMPMFGKTMKGLSRLNLAQIDCAEHEQPIR